MVKMKEVFEIVDARNKGFVVELDGCRSSILMKRWVGTNAKDEYVMKKS